MDLRSARLRILRARSIRRPVALGLPFFSPFNVVDASAAGQSQEERLNRSYRAFLLATLVSAFAFTHADAQRLSVRRYNVADGLAHDEVTSLLQDSRGYLWIGTFEGVSRFDGYSFVSYSLAHGLGTYVINGLAEDAQGRLWVATNGSGLARLDDTAGAPKAFSTHAPGPGPAVNVNVVVRDNAGRLWCGRDDSVWMGILGVGLVEFREGKATAHPVPWVPPARFEQILPDGAGGVFVASTDGVYYIPGAIPQFDRARRLPVQAIVWGRRASI